MKDWKAIYKTENPIRAEIVKDILENKGFNPIMINKKEFVSQVGSYEIMVMHDELLRAKKTIEDEIRFD